MRCEQCHKEHEGLKPIIRADQALCVSCHGDLKRQAAKTTLMDTADFERHHPDFRPNVVVDPWTPSTKRIGLKAKPREMSNVRFSHKKHLDPKGVRSPEGKKKLDCGACHRADAGGAGMKPIDMENHCQACHTLDFEKNSPSLRHQRPEAVEATIRGYYSALAIRGGVKDADAPPAVRRRAGTPLPVTATTDVLTWVNKRTAKGVAFAFSKARCGFCHEVRKDGAGTAGGTPGEAQWRIKARLADRWLVKGNFDHAGHSAVTCTQCHKATTSDISADVLLPSLASCRECHGGEKATNKVPSTCIMCHDFHLSGQGRM
jgi:predicted CXXCH cytochrome family protein